MYFRTNLTCLKRLTFLYNWRMTILPRFNCISLILILKKWPDPLCFQIFCRSARKRFEISFSFWLLLAINTKKDWDFSWLAFSSFMHNAKLYIFRTHYWPTFDSKFESANFPNTIPWQRLCHSFQRNLTMTASQYLMEDHWMHLLSDKFISWQKQSYESCWSKVHQGILN